MGLGQGGNAEGLAGQEHSFRHACHRVGKGRGGEAGILIPLLPLSLYLKGDNRALPDTCLTATGLTL